MKDAGYRMQNQSHLLITFAVIYFLFANTGISDAHRSMPGYTDGWDSE
jgi:hypothetical protein